jgi:hypothetical protein
MNVIKIAGTATLTGAMAAAVVGFGASAAQAAPNHPNPGPVHSTTNPVPSTTSFTAPPGQIGRTIGVAPGQFKKMPDVTVSLPNGTTATISNPFMGVAPGHWDQFQGQWDTAVTSMMPGG